MLSAIEKRGRYNY